jgi:hypothetical protein
LFHFTYSGSGNLRTLSRFKTFPGVTIQAAEIKIFSAKNHFALGIELPLDAILSELKFTPFALSRNPTSVSIIDGMLFSESPLECCCLHQPMGSTSPRVLASVGWYEQ